MTEQIPVFLVNRNRISFLKNMIEDIKSFPGAVPIVIDNQSSYPPLLEYYSSNPCRVVRLDSNTGHTAGWTQGVVEEITQEMDADYYVYSDPDLGLGKIPKDVLEKLLEASDMYPQYLKIGLSLEIEDLPHTLMARNVREWESMFWTHHDSDGHYFAPCDTTFALYRTEEIWKVGNPTINFLSGIRLGRPYTADHRPWRFELVGDRIMCDGIDMTEEENFYRENVKTATHWALHSITPKDVAGV